MRVAAERRLSPPNAATIDPHLLSSRSTSQDTRNDRAGAVAILRAGARRQAGRPAGFLQRADPGSRIGPQAGNRRRPGVDPRSRLFDHSRARPQRRRRRPLGGHADRRGIGRGAEAHDDAARLRRAHADGAAPGQDLVLYAAHGRGGGQLRVPARARTGRHELSDLPAGRALDRRRLSDGRNDEPDLFERRGPAQGPSASGDVCLQGARLLFDFGESRDAIHPGGGLGDGLGDQERHENRGRLDRRRRHGGVGFSCGAWRSPRRIGRLSC